MGINALTDVRFLVTQESHASLREYLLNCHRAEWALHKDIAGFRYTAQLRLAASVAAVALRYVDNLPRKVRSRALLESGLPEHAVDAALQDVEPGSDLFSGAQPFMQRPAVAGSASESAWAYNWAKYCCRVSSPTANINVWSR